jgi:hypothetical protein
VEATVRDLAVAEVLTGVRSDQWRPDRAGGLHTHLRVRVAVKGMTATSTAQSSGRPEGGDLGHDDGTA